MLKHPCARVALMGAALFVASPAVGAPAKRHKPKHAAPAPAAPAATPTEDDAAANSATERATKPDAPSVKLEDTPPPKPHDEDLPPPRSKPVADRAAPVPAEATPKSERQEPTSHSEAATRREAARLSAGRIEVAVSSSLGIGSRRFTYSDPVGRGPAPYRLPIAPVLSFGLEAYPLASTDVPGLRDLGFRGHISRAFAFDSKTPDGSKLGTTWTRFAGELRERLIVPGPHRFELGIDAGADASYFVMSSQVPVGALLPTARTIALRFGLDARVLVTGQFFVMLGAGYLATTSRGEIYDRFRKPQVAGLDTDLGCALGLLPGLDAELTGRYTRYFASFKPHLGDPAVAGGALDEQLQLGLGVRYAH